MYPGVEKLKIQKNIKITESQDMGSDNSVAIAIIFAVFVGVGAYLIYNLVIKKDEPPFQCPDVTCPAVTCPTLTCPECPTSSGMRSLGGGAISLNEGNRLLAGNTANSSPCGEVSECNWELGQCQLTGSDYDGSTTFYDTKVLFEERVAQDRAIAVVPWMDAGKCKRIISWAIEYGYDNVFDDTGSILLVADTSIMFDNPSVIAETMTKWVKRDRLRVFEAAAIRARLLAQLKQYDYELTNKANNNLLVQSDKDIWNALIADTKKHVYVIASSDAGEESITEHSSAVTMSSSKAPSLENNRLSMTRFSILTIANNYFTNNPDDLKLKSDEIISKPSYTNLFQDSQANVLGYHMSRIYQAAYAFVASVPQAHSAVAAIALAENKTGDRSLPPYHEIGIGCSFIYRDTVNDFPKLRQRGGTNGENVANFEDQCLIAMTDYVKADACSRAGNILREKLRLNNRDSKGYNNSLSLLVENGYNAFGVVLISKKSGVSIPVAENWELDTTNSYIWRYENSRAVNILQGRQLRN